MKPRVIVLEERCTGCKLCVELCPSMVFELVNGVAKPVRESHCILCYACIPLCDEKAIVVEDIDP